MSVMAGLLSKLEFVRETKLNVVRLEPIMMPIRNSIPKMHVHVSRAWYTQQSAEEFQYRELARRNFNQASVGIAVNR